MDLPLEIINWFLNVTDKGWEFEIQKFLSWTITDKIKTFKIILVRTVEEILEQTRVIINPQADFNRPEIFRPEENKNHENAFDKNRHEDREFGREKDVYEYENYPPPPKISRSQSLESGLSEMISLLDEIDKGLFYL